ncbi:MAG TPA: hypothetical protein VMJ52_19505, partial [Xanthobacteraceae bacterium]|nr:hypothetical protein [Xanthobacteraceae bacterium]
KIQQEHFPVVSFVSTSKDVRGPGMAPREVAACYRLYAAYCAEVAAGALPSARKVALLDMAQAWSKLADLTEKAAEQIADKHLSHSSASPHE